MMTPQQMLNIYSEMGSAVRQSLQDITITGIQDTPSGYQGHSGDYLVVNDNESGIHFTGIEKIASDLTDYGFLDGVGGGSSSELNLNFETKYLTASYSSNSIINDLTFNNLIIGNTYRMSSTLSFITEGDAEQYVKVDFYNGENNKILSLYNQGKSTSLSTSLLFKSEGTDLFLSGVDLSSIDYISGSPDHVSFVQLEEVVYNAGEDTLPTPSITPSNTVTPTITPTNTVTPTITPTNTVTLTITPTNTVTPTITPTNTVTSTITPSNTATPTITPSNTATPTITPSNTATPTITPSNTATPTITPSITPSITPTSTLLDSDNDGIPDIDDSTPLLDPIPIPLSDDPTLDLASYSTMPAFPTFRSAAKNVEQSNAGYGTYSRFTIRDFKNKNYISHLGQEGINCYIGQSSHHSDCTYTWYKGPGSDSDNIFLAPPARPNDNSSVYSSYQCYYRDWRYYTQEDYKYFPSYSTFDNNEVITSWRLDHGWNKVIDGSSIGFTYNLDYYRWNHKMNTTFDKVYMQNMSLLNIELDEIHDMKKMEIILTQDNPYCIFRYKVRQGGRTNVKGWWYRNHSHKIIFELKEGETIKRLRFLPENRLEYCGVQKEDPDGWINIRMPRMHGLLCDDYPTVDLYFGNEDNPDLHKYYSSDFSRIKFFELYELHGWQKQIVIDETPITLKYEPSSKRITFDFGSSQSTTLNIQDKVNVTLDSGVEFQLYFYKIKNGSAILGLKSLSIVNSLQNGENKSIDIYELSNEQYIQVLGSNVEATLTIGGQGFVVKEDNGSLLWDYGTSNQQSISSSGGQIVISLASNRELTLTFYKSGSLFFSLLKTFDPVTPSPTPTPSSTPPVTPTPTITPSTVVYNCLSGQNNVSIQDGKYIFNNKESKHYMGNGEFKFLNVPIEHPIAFYDEYIGDITGSYSDFSYTGDSLFGSKQSVYASGNDSRVHNFYYGNVTLNIGSEFGGSLSYECYNHGYMGGNNNLEFNPVVCESFYPTPSITPTPSTTPTPTATPTKLGCVSSPLTITVESEYISPGHSEYKYTTSDSSGNGGLFGCIDVNRGETLTIFVTGDEPNLLSHPLKITNYNDLGQAMAPLSGVVKTDLTEGPYEDHTYSLTWQVPCDEAIDKYQYQCENHAGMRGTINVLGVCPSPTPTPTATVTPTPSITPTITPTPSVSAGSTGDYFDTFNSNEEMFLPITLE